MPSIQSPANRYFFSVGATQVQLLRRPVLMRKCKHDTLSGAEVIFYRPVYWLSPKFIAVDEQFNHRVMHQNRFREANGCVPTV
jgi:hypothetical protein